MTTASTTMNLQTVIEKVVGYQTTIFVVVEV